MSGTKSKIKIITSYATPHRLGSPQVSLSSIIHGVDSLLILVRYRRPHYSKVKYELYLTFRHSLLPTLLLPKIENAIAHFKLLLVRGKSQKVKCMICTVRLITLFKPQVPGPPAPPPQKPPLPFFSKPPNPQNSKKVKIPQPMYLPLLPQGTSTERVGEK